MGPYSDPAPDPGRDRRRCRPGRGAAAEIAGYGPIPAAIACDILAGTEGRRWWRRLFTSPTGDLVGADPRRRCFDGMLGHLIRVRDGGRCRDPFCDAPIRHLDHTTPTARAAPPAWSTVAGCAPAATTSANYPAGTSN